MRTIARTIVFFKLLLVRVLRRRHDEVKDAAPECPSWWSGGSHVETNLERHNDSPREGFDFTGHRVGVIGTGSSGVQTIPIVADQAQHLYVFQRSAAFTRPANNRLIAPDEMKRLKAEYPKLRRRQLAPRPLDDVEEMTHSLDDLAELIAVPACENQSAGTKGALSA